MYLFLNQPEKDVHRVIRRSAEIEVRLEAQFLWRVADPPSPTSRHVSFVLASQD